MSKAANIAAAVAIVSVVRAALDRLGLDAEVRSLATALDLLDSEPSAEAKRSKSYRDRKRDAVTPTSRPVTVAKRDATAGEGVTRHAEITVAATNPSPSALPLSSSLGNSESADVESHDQREEKSAHASRDDEPHASRDIAPHVRPVVPRATRVFDDDEPRDPEESEVDRVAAVLSKAGIAGVSHKDRERVRGNLPLLRALATERDSTPAAVLAGAKARFDADCAAKGKDLGNPVLLAQVELWAKLPPAPTEPRRLIPLYEPPVVPERPADPETTAEGLALVEQALRGGAFGRRPA